MLQRELATNKKEKTRRKKYEKDTRVDSRSFPVWSPAAAGIAEIAQPAAAMIRAEELPAVRPDRPAVNPLAKR